MDPDGGILPRSRRPSNPPRPSTARIPAVLVVLACFTLAGCIGTEPATEADSRTDPDTPAVTPDVPTTRPGPETVAVRGHVLDEAIRPVAGATVTLVTRGTSVETGPDGAFDLGLQPRGILTLRAEAPGFMSVNTTVLPDDVTEDVRIVLARGMPVVPYNQTYAFKGLLQCAFEAAIISPSCDSAIVAAGADPVFGTNQSFLFDADPAWRTIVIDVVFDASQHPGLDGLRAALRGSNDTDGGGAYEQYGRWHAPEPFTIRIEPGGNYTDGVGPVPATARGFQSDVYPHSHAYHPGGAGFLGVGAAIDVEFQLFATIFYVEAAPEGFSFAIG